MIAVRSLVAIALLLVELVAAGIVVGGLVTLGLPWALLPPLAALAVLLAVVDRAARRPRL